MDKIGVGNSTSNIKAWSHGKRYENGSIGGKDLWALGIWTLCDGTRKTNVQQKHK